MACVDICYPVLPRDCGIFDVRRDALYSRLVRLPSAGKVALAWVLAQGQDIIPIPGTTRLEVCRGTIVFKTRSLYSMAIITESQREPRCFGCEAHVRGT